MNSLGIDKEPRRTRVVVAMSGGVDSSVAAGLLAEQGYDVVGVTLRLYDQGPGRKGACCAGQDINDARAVAERLGIPHYVLDYSAQFRADVMEPFADAYARGETPIPCVACNQTVKFRDLLGAARQLDADALATGHYVRRIAGEHGPELHRPIDAARDQSYFLFATTAAQLAMLRFPLGDMRKAEVRQAAHRLGIAVADKPDSQDICFVASGGYASVVERLRPGAAAPGEIIDLQGRVLGNHRGVMHYTIGQRRGLGVGGRDDPLYVVRLEPETRRVVVGPVEALACRSVPVRDVNWLAGEDRIAPHGVAVEVKLRSAQIPVPAVVHPASDGGAVVTLAEPQLGVAPGQAAVFYRGSRVLGGGWITRAPALEHYPVRLKPSGSIALDKIARLSQ